MPYDLLPQNSIADFLTKSHHCGCEAICLWLIVFPTVKATDLIVVTSFWKNSYIKTPSYIHDVFINHRYTHAHIYSPACTYSPIYIHLYTQMHTHLFTNIQAPLNTHSPIYTPIYMYTHPYTYSPTHRDTYSPTHTHTYSLTYTYSPTHKHTHRHPYKSCWGHVMLLVYLFV